MKKFICSVCGYSYDEEEQSLAFDELPNDYVFPLCGAPHTMFNPL